MQKQTCPAYAQGVAYLCFHEAKVNIFCKFSAAWKLKHSKSIKKTLFSFVIYQNRITFDAYFSTITFHRFV